MSGDTTIEVGGGAALGGAVPPLPDDLVPHARRTFVLVPCRGKLPHFQCDCGVASRFAERDHKLASKLRAWGCWVVCHACTRMAFILP